MVDLTKIIEETIKKVINEGISDIVYHFCGLAIGYNICKTNKIFFTPSINTQSESDLNGKNSYFLSTTRQRNTNFGYSVRFSSGNSVRITLDGRKLRENLSGKPTDYWYTPSLTLNSKQSYYKDKSNFSTAQHHISNESEDRLFSRKQILDNASKYILSVDVFLRNNMLDEEKKAYIDKFLSTPLSNLIRIFDNQKDFNSLDGRNAINSKYNFTPSQDVIDSVNNNLTLSDGFFYLDENNKYLGIMGEFLFIIFYDNKKIRDNRSKCENEIVKLLKKYGLDELLPNVPSYYDEMMKKIRSGYRSSDFIIGLSNVKGLMGNPNETTEKLTRLIVDYCKSIGAYSIEDVKRIKKDSLNNANNASQKIKCMKFYYGNKETTNSRQDCNAIVLDINNTPFYNVIQRAAFGDKESAEYNINDAIRGIANEFEEENYEYKSRNIESFKKYLYHVFKYGSVSDVLNAISNNSNLMELFKYHFYLYPKIEYIDIDDLVYDATYYDEYQTIVDFPIEWREDKIKKALEERMM